MDTLQEKLDALDRQSKEQIAAVIASLEDAFEHGVQANRIAVAIGGKMTTGNVGGSFPVICLLDAMVAQGDRPCVAKVLQEFWAVSVPLFTNYAKADACLREKVMRALKRWCSKKAIAHSLCESLVGAVSGEQPTVEGGARVVGSGRGCSASGGTHLKDNFTRSEVSSFCAILRNCTKMIERLPPHRASMYQEVACKEMTGTAPSRRSLLFLQGFHAELSRELNLYNASAVKSEAQASAGADSGTSARAALSSLLAKISEDQAHDFTASIVIKDHGFHVARYTSPFQSDVCQRLSLAQRTGFGEWHRRPKSEYHYPKKESNPRRVFRAPAGSGPQARVWFPGEQQWITAGDMVSLSLLRTRGECQPRETSSLYDVARKRDREA
ncbi:hypothetical protein ERJ75_000270500 [Trypanosoma vivax]|nr:hypothetical protein ERJ75_000683100 [Trypanosoma vivax]KAH8614519.1 hypothetical protein ERJ75_000682700 [Trypanosoma vivax]KAH8618395.1 hypothetical protein ERJ75_000270500 [Trypanosoma vivax]